MSVNPYIEFGGIPWQFSYYSGMMGMSVIESGKK